MHQSAQPHIYALGPYELDVRASVLTVGGAVVPLGPKVVQTLIALVRCAGEPVSKDALLAQVWPEGCASEANLAQNIYVLRKTLAAHWHVPSIETMPRRGYRFIGPVRVLAVARRSAPARRRMPYRWRAALAGAFATFLSLLLSLDRSDFHAVSSTPDTARSMSDEGRRLYDLGRYYWDQRTASSVAKSIVYFKRAAGAQPHSALAYSGLADAYSIMADYGYGARSMRYCDLARDAARKAVALDPASSAAHASLGFVKQNFDHDPAAAAIEFRRALALDPANATAHHWYGTGLLARGDFQQARSELETAVRLKPASPSINAWLASTYYFSRDYAAAVAFGKQALELDPHRVDALVVVGLAYEGRKDYASALRTFKQLAARGQSGEALALSADAHARTGRTLESLREIRMAMPFIRRNQVEPQDIAVTMIALGKREAALIWLKKSKLDATQARIWLAFDPRLDPVRNDQRFKRWTTPRST